MNVNEIKKREEVRNMGNMPKINLAAVRVNANLSQAELAEKLDVTRGTIINWEKGYARMQTSSLIMFAKVCNDFPLDYIFLPSTSTESR